MSIDTTGNRQIDQAASEIALTLRDACPGRSDRQYYDEAQRLRDEIIVGTLAMAGVLPLWEPANNGTSKRRWFLVRGLGMNGDLVPLRQRYHNGPSGKLVRFASIETAQRAAVKLNSGLS